MNIIRFNVTIFLLMALCLSSLAQEKTIEELPRELYGVELCMTKRQMDEKGIKYENYTPKMKVNKSRYLRTLTASYLGVFRVFSDDDRDVETVVLRYYNSQVFQIGVIYSEEAIKKKVNEIWNTILEKYGTKPQVREEKNAKGNNVSKAEWNDERTYACADFVYDKDTKQLIGLNFAIWDKKGLKAFKRKQEREKKKKEGRSY